MIDTVNVGAAEWLNFVSAQAEATPFHHPSWARVVSEVYAFESRAVVWRDGNGEIAAGLPAIRVPSLGRRAQWKCLPFTDECGPLGSSSSVRSLMNSLRGSPHEEWEVRDAVPTLGAVRPVAVRHRLDLRAGADAVYRGFHRSQVQRALRKADREGLVNVRQADDEADLTVTYYTLHVATRKRQGLPPQPRRLFKAIWRQMHTTGLACTRLAEIGGQPVAGAMFLTWNGKLIYKYGASLAEHWRARPNHMIFWDVIRDGCEQGIERLDLGLTDATNSGLRAFKSNWGAREEPLAYTYSRRVTQPHNSGHSRAAAAVGTAIRHSPPRVCELIGDALYRFAA